MVHGVGTISFVEDIFLAVHLYRECTVQIYYHTGISMHDTATAHVVVV